MPRQSVLSGPLAAAPRRTRIPTAAAGDRLDDHVLVGMSRRGHGPALAELYKRYGATAYRFASAVCPSPRGAERAVEHTFVAISRGVVQTAPTGSVCAWLLGVVHQYAQAEVSERDGVPGPMSRLPEGQREVFALALFGNLSCAEIAACLSIPASTVKRLIATALRELGDGAGSAREPLT